MMRAAGVRRVFTFDKHFSERGLLTLPEDINKSFRNIQSGRLRVNEREQLEQAIAAQEALRGTLPDEVIEATIGASPSHVG